MTCIVGYIDKKKVYIGGDSAGSTEYRITIRKDPKVFKKGNMIFGFTSSFRMGQLLQFDLKIPSHPKNMSDYEYMVSKFIKAVRVCFKQGAYTSINNGVEEGGHFLVGYKSNLYKIEADFQVQLGYSNYMALGAGEYYALGALHAASEIGKLLPEEIVTLALQAAGKFTPGVEGPYNIVCL
jgi:ATP-dependent protease HslVU (ClpYQ) peptidase subunit